MSAPRPKVLIVDDEDNIVLALYRVLYQDNHYYDVLLARTAEVAQQIVAEMRIDVLVTDVHLPEKSGMDLLSWVAQRTPHTRLILMTAFDVNGIKDRAHAYGCLRLMRKPFDVHDMRATILRALAHRDSFAGSLAELATVDVIQMLCIARKTMALRLSEGPSTGVVHIENGEIVHAVWDSLVGEAAFYRIMAVKRGLFSTSPLPPDVDRTVHADWQFLLIEGTRRIDEAVGGLSAAAGPASASETRDEERPSLRFTFSGSSIPPTLESTQTSLGNLAPPPLPAIPPASWSSSQSRPRESGRLSGADEAPADAQANADVARLVDQGFRALRAGRRDEAQEAWEEALRLDPSNRRIELNLKKLGVLSPASARESAGPPRSLAIRARS